MKFRLKSLIGEPVTDLREPIDGWLSNLKAKMIQAPPRDRAVADNECPASPNAGVRIYVVDPSHDALLRLKANSEELMIASMHARQHGNAGLEGITQQIVLVLAELKAGRATVEDVTPLAVELIVRTGLFHTISVAYQGVDGHWLLALVQLFPGQPYVLAPAYRVHHSAFFTDEMLMDWLDMTLSYESSAYREKLVRVA